jgi:hypothetical protein
MPTFRGLCEEADKFRVISDQEELTLAELFG